MKAAAQILVDCLVVNCTDRVYGVPGESYLYSRPSLIEVKVDQEALTSDVSFAEVRAGAQ